MPNHTLSRRSALSAGLAAGLAPTMLGVPAAGAAPKSRDAALLGLFGAMPPRPKPQFTVLETTDIEGGQRLKIEYFLEAAYPPLGEPEDRVRAYLMVPNRGAGQRLPAILAFHQDGPQFNLGKAEPVGLAGDANLFYALDLFRRGHVVLCPDRFYHAERRRGVDPAGPADNPRDVKLLDHRVGQLLLRGRSSIGKEVFDAMVATDLLVSLPYVDPARIAGIGHSAGGMMLVHWMAADKRAKAGISSCGLFEMLNFFREDAIKRRSASIALPGLAALGRSADYLAMVAPRNVLLTRGRWEWGTKGEWREASLRHVAETEDMVAHARARGSGKSLDVIYFDEAGGNHDFPPGVRDQAYAWLKTRL
ncbi:prolyl oligopeptidase family serine peptidase [Sphingomonas sp. HITSZ_GF]|uniref:alpha/beta hydrolase family protein n=1 Tax=Sphingomonas sp. HITSZ_GF TaxID=3037247 RepID=UPI00240E98CA|nr:prolyl oligopeptidase family serine peptidase [Sphingomonas sp. HITSZ_GF]MDG2535948.1 prolyl oligopeptidase family serine peptidase [Sphingomonas sp. HITSZ_GF]